MWRFELNDYPADRLSALNFTDPLARADDAVVQPGRSSSEDQRRELEAAIDGLLARTGTTTSPWSGVARRLCDPQFDPERRRAAA